MSGTTTPTLLDGKTVARRIEERVKREIAALAAAGAAPPTLAAVLVGENPASQVYVRSKRRAVEGAGGVSRVLEIDAAVSQEELLARIDALNRDDAVDGILVQLPLPEGLDEAQVLARVDPAKDVDGFHPVSVGRLWLDQPGFAPATPSGIMEMLRQYGIELKGSNAVIVGRSAIVGKPMAALLLRQHATVTLCHSRTRDLERVCRGADLLVAAIGRPAFFGPEHVGEGAVVIDVGINRVDDADAAERLFPGDEKRRKQFAKRGYVLVGDVDFTRVAPRCAAITPVPGGVGPLTVAMLLSNTVAAARARRGLLRSSATGAAAGPS